LSEFGVLTTQIPIVRAGPLLLAVVIAAIGGQNQSRRIGSIDFYGYAGLNIDQIKSALPIKVGDPFPGPAETIGGIDKAVKSIIGRQPIDVSPVCCDAQGNFMIYIGLPGASIKPTKLNPVPKAKINFPPENSRRWIYQNAKFRFLD
jgi:hypothetical protein